MIVLTTYDTDDEITSALKAGAKAYVLKDISADDLVNCIRDVLAGKTYLAPAAAAKLAEGVTRVQLTPRGQQAEWSERKSFAHRRHSDGDPGDSTNRSVSRLRPARRS